MILISILRTSVLDQLFFLTSHEVLIGVVLVLDLVWLP